MRNKEKNEETLRLGCGPWRPLPLRSSHTPSDDASNDDAVYRACTCDSLVCYCRTTSASTALKDVLP